MECRKGISGWLKEVVVEERRREKTRDDATGYKTNECEQGTKENRKEVGRVGSVPRNLLNNQITLITPMNKLNKVREKVSWRMCEKVWMWEGM